MLTQPQQDLPPGQQLVAAGKWPIIGEREPASINPQWALKISGRVEQPITFSLEQLQALPQKRQIIDIHCVTRWSKLGVEFEGVPVADLLDIVRTGSDAKFVSFISHSARKHSTSLPLDDVVRHQTLIALKADGQPISLDHGGPIRNIVPGKYFYKSVKWLNEMELLEQDRLGYWEAESGYHNGADPWREQRYIASSIDRREAAKLIESRNFSDQDLLSIAANNRDLRGLDARRAKLRNADFSRADLREANFSNANLSNANLQCADVRGANFSGADLEGANFSGADLRGANLLGTSLIGGTFFDPALGVQGEAQWDAQTRISQTEISVLFPLQLDFVMKQGKKHGLF